MRGPDLQSAARREVPAFAVPSAAYASPTATRSFFISIGLHLLLVSGLVSLDNLQSRQAPRLLTVDELIADDAHQLTWYVAKQEELPAVSPPEPEPQSAGQSGTPRFRMPQQITANDPAAESGRQMIWDEVPEIELPQDVPSQNMLAWSPPEVTMPRYQLERRPADAPSARALELEAAPQLQPNRLGVNLAALQDLPKLRYQTAQQQAQAQPEKATLSAVAPAIAAASPSTPGLERIQPLAPLRYWTPEQQQAQPAQPTLSAEAVPQVQVAAVNRPDVTATQLPRLRYWTEQRQAATPSPQAIGKVEAPMIVAASPGAASLPAQALPRLRYWRPEQQAAAPSGTALAAVAASAGQPSALPLGGGPPRPGSDPGADLVQAQALALLSRVSAPPGPAGTGGGPAQPSRAVVGIDPDRDASEARGSRKGRFTAGPLGGEGEGAGEKGSGTGSGLAGTGSGSRQTDSGSGVSGSGAAAPIRIPNLAIGGAPVTVAAVTALPRPDPGDLQGRDSLLRRVPDARLESPPPLPGQIPEPPPNPDAPLLGKSVYTLAVNMPNVSSYSGSWVIQFAELNDDKQPGDLAPPSPRYKVDPKYVRSAIEEEIEGEVVLHAVIRRDGQVDHIRVMKSLDERLDDSAMAALSKWRFNPATKAGLPVDIETVVRIPFRLAPEEEPAR